MTRKLIVHIGANKTGSSAIQRFLALNCGLLRASGIVVPDNEFSLSDRPQGFHVFGFEKLLRQADGRVQLEQAIDRVADAAADASTIILSAENLAANGNAPALFKGLAERFDLQVILYVRRQDEYLLSTWQQWYSKIGTDFWAWAISAIGGLGNWQRYLENWESVVPPDRICVRVFERQKLDGADVIRDFCNRCGISRPFEEFAYPDGTVNPSFSEAVMDLVKGNKLIFKDVHDNDFYNLVLEATGHRYVKNGRQSAITFAQRQAILGKYASSNRWVREKYLPGLEGELFSAPEESDYDYLAPDALQAQKLEFLTTLLYRLHKKGNT
jgi:hypothetical protein